MESQLKAHFGPESYIGKSLVDLCVYKHNSHVVTLLLVDAPALSSRQERLSRAWNSVSQTHIARVDNLVAQIKLGSSWKRVVEMHTFPCANHEEMMNRLASMKKSVRTLLEEDRQWVMNHIAPLWPFLKNLLGDSTQVDLVEQDIMVVLETPRLSLARLAANQLMRIFIAVEDAILTAIQHYTDIFYAVMQGIGQTHRAIIMETLYFFTSMMSDMMRFVLSTELQKTARMQTFSKLFVERVQLISSLIGRNDTSYMDASIRSNWAHDASFGSAFRNGESIVMWFVHNDRWLAGVVAKRVRFAPRYIVDSLHSGISLCQSFLQPVFSVYAQHAVETKRTNLDLMRMTNVLQKMVERDDLKPETKQRVQDAIDLSENVVKDYAKYLEFLQRSYERRNHNVDTFLYNDRLAKAITQTTLILEGNPNVPHPSIEEISAIYQHFNGKTPEFDVSTLHEALTFSNAQYIIAIGELLDPKPPFVGGRTPGTVPRKFEEEEEEEQPLPPPQETLADLQEQFEYANRQYETALQDLENYEVQHGGFRDRETARRTEDLFRTLERQERAGRDLQSFMYEDDIAVQAAAIVRVTEDMDLTEFARLQLRLYVALQQRNEIAIRLNQRDKLLQDRRYWAGVFAILGSIVFTGLLFYYVFNDPNRVSEDLFLAPEPTTQQAFTNLFSYIWSRTTMAPISFRDVSNPQTAWILFQKFYENANLWQLINVPRASQYAAAMLSFSQMTIGSAAFVYFLIYTLSAACIDIYAGVGYRREISTDSPTAGGEIVQYRTVIIDRGASRVFNYHLMRVLNSMGYTVTYLGSSFLSMWLAISAGQFTALRNLGGVVGQFLGPAAFAVFNPGAMVGNLTTYMTRLEQSAAGFNWRIFFPSAETMRQIVPDSPFEEQNTTVALVEIRQAILALPPNHPLLDTTRRIRALEQNTTQQRQLLQGPRRRAPRIEEIEDEQL